MDIRLFQQLPVLFLETAAQFELGGENSIFGQTAEFDIAIQHDHFMAGFRQRTRHRHPCGPGSHDNDNMRLFSAHALILAEIK
jgi:hypothetical protein